jgi:hypothetical protein
LAAPQGGLFCLAEFTRDEPPQFVIPAKGRRNPAGLRVKAHEPEPSFLPSGKLDAKLGSVSRAV